MGCIVDGKQFIDWLVRSKGMSFRSARDVLSRSRRSQNYVDITLPITDAELVFRMTQSPGFDKLTPCVKSQLKRAVILIREFLAVNGVK